MKHPRICYIGNIASHYRANIFHKMCEELSCDFFYGEPFSNIRDIKSLPTSFFPTHAEVLHNVVIPGINKFWQKGAVSLLKRDYDVYIMFAEMSYLSTWTILFLNKFFYHKKIIFWGHGLNGAESSLKKRIKCFFYKLSDRILVYGDRAIGLMKKEGFDSNKLFPIHNSLDYERQQKVLQTISSKNLVYDHYKNNYPTIVFSGRLTAVKRIDMIIDALSIIKKDGIMINCILIGKGSEEESLKKTAKERGLSDQLWFYGECYDESVIGNIYWNSSVCVSPGNVGLTAIHSLTYGCPVITHNDFAKQMPEFEAIIPGKTGAFFEYENIASLAETIKKWVSISEENRFLIKKQCQKIVQTNWNPDYQITIIQKAILSCSKDCS